jgi:hypothetical protein
MSRAAVYHAAIKNRYGLQTIASEDEQEFYEDIWNMSRDTNDWKAQFDDEDPAEGKAFKKLSLHWRTTTTEPRSKRMYLRAAG